MTFEWQHKIARARQHHSEFLAGLERLANDPPYRLIPSREGTDIVVRVALTGELPEQLSLVAGDLVHNARSALDIMIFELAQRGDGLLKRVPNDKEQRSLYFPITRDADSYARAARALAPFVSDSALERVEALQPWRPPAEDFQASHDWAVATNMLARLSVLDNIDKHRMLLFALWRPDSIEHKSLAEPEGAAGGAVLEPSELELLNHATEDELPALLHEMLSRHPSAEDEYDFFFSDDPLIDGAEVGRFIRHDGRPMATGMAVAGTLRVTLWEPGLTGSAIGGPPANALLAELTDASEAACQFVFGAESTG